MQHKIKYIERIEKKVILDEKSEINDFVTEISYRFVAGQKLMMGWQWHQLDYKTKTNSNQLLSR